MSFTRLLAAGRSIMGIRKKPGPYRMTQQHLLPKFAPVQKAPAVASDTRQDEAENEPAAKASGDETARTAVAAPVPAAVASIEPPRSDKPLAGKKTEGTPFSALASRWSRWKGRRTAPVSGKTGDRVQGELSLDRVKVVRNDLSDSDFEVVRADIRTAARPPALQPSLGMVWNRLSARLLRQAALEFNLVQKERGKLLSQAGPGSGGAEGT
jgi:hypothetical protein